MNFITPAAEDGQECGFPGQLPLNIKFRYGLPSRHIIASPAPHVEDAAFIPDACRESGSTKYKLDHDRSGLEIGGKELPPHRQAPALGENAGVYGCQRCKSLATPV